MARNAALQSLLDAEKRQRLWSRRVLGVPVWPFERFPEYQRRLVRAEVGAGAPGQRTTNPVGNLANRTLTSFRNLWERRALDPRRDIWVLSASNYRRRDASGTYQCIFAEHLRRQLGDRLLFVERNAADLPLQHREDVLFIDAAFIGAEAAGRASAPFVAKSPLGADVRDTEGVISANVLCRDAVYARVLLALAREWIRRARPRAVFVLNAYHLFIPFQMAVREAGIPLIELQHGLIAESHPGYIFEDAPALPHLPDHLVVFGRQFGELLDRESPRWRGRWTVGGHPWLKEKRRGIDELPDSALDTVVLFSQSVPFVRERLRALAPELRARLDPKLKLVYKPHPGEVDAPDYYRSLAGTGIELSTPREDTYELLRRCRLSVAVYSTVAMEALAFRCRSALLPAPMWTEDLRDLVNQGALDVANDVEDIARLAQSGPTGTRGSDLPNRLFGVRELEPDFERLIEQVRSGL